MHAVGAQQILYFIPLASSCACVYIEGWCSSGFCYKFCYESISKSAGFHFRAGHSAFSERTVSGLNCPLNCMLRWQQSLRREFFTNRPPWNRAWLENRMNKLAQLANSLHSLTLICTKGGSQSSQHKLNSPKDGHDSLSAVQSPTSSDPVASGLLNFVYCSAETAYVSHLKMCCCSFQLQSF